MYKHTVVDTEGEKWLVKFDFFRAQAIKEAIGVDIFSKEMGQKLTEGKVSGLELAYIVNSPKAIERGLTKASFYDRFESFDIAEHSANAVADFFQSQAKKVEPNDLAKSEKAGSNGGHGTLSGDLPPAQE